MRAVSQKFAIYKTAGIYSIVFEYIYFSEVTLLELYTNPTNNIRKLCGLEPTTMPDRKGTFIPGDSTVNIQVSCKL